MKRKLILDVDTGVDDAQAILYALSRSDCEVLGITCVGGNVSLDLVTRNTRLVTNAALQQLKSDNSVPVYCGSEQPLAGGQLIGASVYHGLDGLASIWGQSESLDKQLHSLVDKYPMGSIQAALALIEMVSNNKGEVTVIALAPLTNLVLAQRLEPRFSGWLKDLFIMGGAHHARGNNELHFSAEFNFVHDPEAAYVVLQEFDCSKTLVTYECCVDNAFDFDWVRSDWISDTVVESCGVVGKLMLSMVEHQLHRQKPLKMDTSTGIFGFRSCDLFAICVCLNPQLIVDSFSKLCTVELHGQHTRGQLVIDWYNKVSRGLSQVKVSPIKFITKLDVPALRSALIDMMKAYQL